MIIKEVLTLEIKLILPVELDNYSINTFNMNFNTLAEHIQSVYTQLNETANVEDIPTKLSQLNDDINIVTMSEFADLISDKVDINQYEQLVVITHQIREIVARLSRVATTGNYEDLHGKPELGPYLNYRILKRGE